MRSLSLKIIYRNDEESVTRKNIGRFKRQPREMPSKILISNDGPSVGSKKFEHCEIKPLKIFGANDEEFIEEKIFDATERLNAAVLKTKGAKCLCGFESAFFGDFYSLFYTKL